MNALPLVKPNEVRSGESRSTALRLLRDRSGVSRQELQAAGFADLDALAQAVADQLRLPRLKLDTLELAKDLSEVVPRAIAERHQLIPVFAAPGEVTVATADPARLELFDWLGRELKRNVVVVVAHVREIEKAYSQLYDAGGLAVLSASTGDQRLTAEALEEASQIVDRVLWRAAELKASDIHWEATEQGTVIRLRVDGMLRVLETRPIKGHAALVSRIKVMAALDISEKQVPQDGRIKLRGKTAELDLRVSVLPTYYGEKVVLRILDNARAALSLSELSFDPAQLTLFQKMIHRPYGLVLVTGPTGSGKSTTLYGALNALRRPDINIVSVEDPVEYQLPGINQVQVNPKRGMTFPLALRAILRQDPNVILVGEIRDRETATIATEAALTGHLVLASLHTNDAPSAVVRLAEIGVEPHLIAAALVGVVAQRLVRNVCGECSRAYVPAREELESLGLPELPAGVSFFEGQGCDACLNTGFAGRTPVRELLDVDSDLRSAIVRSESADLLRERAEARGFKSMRYEALRRLLAGVTTTQEVFRVTSG